MILNVEITQSLPLKGPKRRSPTLVTGTYTSPTSQLPLTRTTQRALAKSPPKLLEGEPGCHALETLRGRIGLFALSRLK